MKNTLKSALLLSTLAIAGSASAASTVWTAGNGHSYEVVVSDTAISWTAARDAAVAAGGYLATLTTADELSFVYDLTLATPSSWNYVSDWGVTMGAWLGGSDAASEGTFEWASNPSDVWDNTLAAATWAPGEPNDQNSNEDYLHFFNAGNGAAMQFNDELNNGSGEVYSYVIEKPVSAVPVPAAAFLFAPALLGFMGLRRKQS